MIAGPSEILVLADGSCNPAWVAADLLSQAEHDKLASPVLVTDSAELAKAVQAELEVQIPQLPRAAIARASVDTNGKIIVTDDMNKAIDAVNIIAPEHFGNLCGRPVRRFEQRKERGQHFPGQECAGSTGRLFCRPQPHPAHQRHRTLFQPAGRGRFCEKSPVSFITPAMPWAKFNLALPILPSMRACTPTPRALPSVLKTSEGWIVGTEGQPFSNI